ncbi:hypothetical protein CK503_04750 [Aliifodinibius salipaludis]|uniref:ABM domain-containing protein n=1 Tax=Fodinibius salipaludis TaxID=2032627 RepID=A0A2A2GBR3_9BACT|nr:antibiotic biosynthesis monooxygenase [Aliifodinibius salipaludis]PAU94788.1 hypothetical protein CK503_04750 [Aliifodinibius salipaludis]
MIVVHIEHFLNEEGRHHFEEWVAEVAQTLRNFEGFISISILEELPPKNESHLLLTFENERLLKKWANSKEHDDLISKLKPYQNRKQVSDIFKQTKKIKK